MANLQAKPGEILELENIALKKLRYERKHVIDISDEREYKCNSYRDHIWGELVCQLETKITAHELSKAEVFVHFEVEVPANWWEHLKKDVFKRKNIKTKTIKKTKKVNIEEYVKYPESKIAKFNQEDYLFADMLGDTAKIVQFVYEEG